MKSKTEFLADLAPVRRALEAWRKTRQHRQPIPEELWRQVAVLGGRHGVSPVSQALGLDYYSLKGRVKDRACASDFVEVGMAPAGDLAQGCTAEFEDRQGRKVLLRWVSTPGPELLGVVRAFWGQAA